MGRTGGYHPAAGVASTGLYTNSVSGNGRFLCTLYKRWQRRSNLYFSERSGPSWSKIRNFGKPVNTIYWESHGFITPDARKLYLSSQPSRYFLANLILFGYQKKHLPAHGENRSILGEVINTPWDEDAPSLTLNNNALLFSSVGTMSMGKYDIFRSTTDRYGNWNQPVGMPFAFNTTAEIIFFTLIIMPRFITSFMIKNRNQEYICYSRGRSCR